MNTMPLPDFAGALFHVVTVLEAAGVRASADPAHVNPPGAWVDAGAAGARPLTVAGAYEVAVDVYLVVPRRAPLIAYRELDELASRVAEVLPLAGLEGEAAAIVPQTLEVPSAGALPAYRFPTTVHTD